MIDTKEIHDIIAAMAEFNAAIGNPNPQIYQEVMEARDPTDLLSKCLLAVSIEPSDLLEKCDEKPRAYLEVAGVMYCIAILMARRGEEMEAKDEENHSGN